MSAPLILLAIRLLSAGLLLAFLGLIAWLIYQDMRLTAAALANRQRQHGLLRVVQNESGNPPVDTIFPLLPITSIGRAANNNVVLADGYASSEHALILRREGQWWLEDRHSRNGTLLNDMPVTGAAVISAGDIIAVGGTHLKIEF